MEKGKSFLFLHKDEWDRMKNVGTQSLEPPTRNEYLQSLIEKSQQWINSWPDSTQGHILKREKQREQHLNKDRAIMNLIKKEQKEIYENNECIEKAKQMIFDDSCYGRRLISALLESKTLEERDAQIEFKKKIKELSPEDHNALQYSLHNAIDIKQDTDQAACRRRIEREIAETNKSTYLIHQENIKKEKEREKQMEIEDLRLIAKLNETEAMHEMNEKKMLKKSLEQFNAEQKQIRDRKLVRENQEERLLEIWRKYEDRKNIIMRKIHEDRFKKSRPTTNYELVKKIHEHKNNRYNEFVNKSIAALAKRVQIKEDEDNQRRANDRIKLNLFVESNKQLADAKRINDSNKNICNCDRQCLIMKRKKSPKLKNISQKQATATFASSKNQLVQDLAIRKNEPSPWSGVSAAHAQFARNAGHTLQQCRYKHTARNVVDDYRKSHGLTPQELPIDNYI